MQPQNRFPFLWPWRIALVCMIIALVFHVISASQENRPIIRFGPATIAALLVFVFAYISLYFGPLQSSAEWNPYIDAIFKTSVCLVLIEAMATTVERVWAVVATIFFATLWWVKAGLRLSSAGATYAHDRLMGPAVSLVSDPNAFAFLITLMIPLYLYFYQHGRQKYVKYGALSCALAAVYIALQTGSRTGVLCLIATGLLAIPRLGRRNPLALIISVVVIFSLLGTVSTLNLERYKTITTSIQEFFAGEYEEKSPQDMTQDEQSAWERKMKNRDSWGLIKAYPIFGVGVNHDDSLIPEEFGYARGEVHNEYLFVGLQMGFIGITLYLVLMFCFAGFSALIQVETAKTWPALSSLGWTLKVMAGIYVVGAFFSPVAWNPLFMALAGASSALWTNYRSGSWNRATEKM